MMNTTRTRFNCVPAVLRLQMKKPMWAVCALLLTFLGAFSLAPSAQAAGPPSVVTAFNTPDADGHLHLNGYVNPNGQPVTDCHFEYGSTTSYGQSAPCDNHPGDELQLLKIVATSGQFRLSLGAETTSNLAFDSTAGEVQLALESLTAIGPTNVTVTGGPTSPTPDHRYRIAFADARANTDLPEIKAINGTAPLCSGTVPICPGAVVRDVITIAPGGLGATSPVAAELTDLNPGATYHYRLLVSNATETVPSPDATFTVAEEPTDQADCPNPGALGATRLNECRAWEMVSPPDKIGGDIMQASARTQIAADGSAAVFSSLIPFGDASGAGLATSFLSTRSPSGWKTHAILPPQLPTTQQALQTGLEPRYLGDFTPDLERGVFLAWRPLDEQDPNIDEVANLYRRDDLRQPGAGSYQLLTSCPICDRLEPEPDKPLPAVALANRPWFAGASIDLSHILIDSTLNLVAGAKGEKPKLYEWDQGTLRIAGILPDGKVAFQSEAGVGGSGLGSGVVPHVISADGSRIIFTSGGNLYLRTDQADTIQLNLPEPGAPVGPVAAASYGDASVDGSRIFFTSEQRLTPDAAWGDNKLYMYDIDRPGGEHLTLLSVDHEPSDPSSNSADGVVGSSSDGHTVYFIDTSQLQAGGPRLRYGAALYIWQEGHTRFLAELPGQDTQKIALYSSDKSSRVSSDGGLYFKSSLPSGPTGYDHGLGSEFCLRDTATAACYEYYTYDPDIESLQCASCNPSGIPADGAANIVAVAGVGASATNARRGRAISSDGTHAFFTSSEALVPEDTNGTEDAYSFNTRTATLNLISTGSDSSPSYFIENNADGSNALLATRERLSAWDIDTNYDLYDARVDGGLPEPVALPAPCQGETCFPPPTPLPGVQTPGSVVFNGAGNPPKMRHRKVKHRRQARHKKHRHDRQPKHSRRPGQ